MGCEPTSDRASTWPFAARPQMELLRDVLPRRIIDALPTLKQVIAGGIAGCVAKTAVAPLSRVTVLMQVQSMRPHKFADGRNPNNQFLVPSLRKIYAEEGINGFWRGNVATCIHRFPYTAITFYTNAAVREWLRRSHGSQLSDQSRNLLAGGSAACAAVCSLHPLDVIKTRLMAQTRSKYYSGVRDAAWKIYCDEGPRGFYRGIGVSLCTTAPSIAINFASFDEFKRRFAEQGLKPDTYLHTFCAGACAGMTASTLMFPMDLVRRQMQMVGVGGRPFVYANAGQAFWRIFRTGVHRHEGSPISWLLGFREFFRGLMPELLKVAPHSAIMFTAQSQLISRQWFGEDVLFEDYS
mmetsp:Transcript_32037/g.73819  ORF Transcript_32037/g.73819 Transcript_32037/m.73819 type:complete len:352 (-) Transcript_32037:239-1294(-)